MSTPTETDAQVILFLQDILEIVLVAGRKGLPAEVVYQEVLSRICSGDDFNALVDILVRAGKIRRKAEYLIDVAPIVIRAEVAGVA